MSVATVISQLKGLLVKAETLPLKFSKVYPSDGQWDTLIDLSSSLSHATKKVEDEIRMLKESRSERAWEESKEHRSNAQSSRGDLFAKGRLKNPHIFRRNIVTIFGGPKDSKFDSEDMKIRKESTRHRCELIRGLSADGVISWAIAYPPTLWAAGSMALDVFTCLLDDIEPELEQAWPPMVRETLHLLKADEGFLESSHVYEEFLEGHNLSQTPGQSRKRRRIESENGHTVPAPTLSAPQQVETKLANRQIQYMFSKGPRHLITDLESPLYDAIRTSNQWELEERLGEETTECMSTLVPRDENEDISITLWVGRREGLRQINKFNQQRTWSALPKHLLPQPQTMGEHHASRS
ncbi:hypothetical protein P171DRAFT_353705 [Karstenula rhodostoma CBS 690.94]|uniref:Uncharacterized protein n=1 Tax=Karstenula rhodostoma CBS 690.94 TaxID=1392251 RepID=A0A9P4UG60_9PLEO|nr:hypothetical protein P171DRAFT_353705 [Karstenula rhodostoma CBS 690.94]